MFISHKRAVAEKQRTIRPGIMRLGMTSLALGMRFCTYAVIARTVGTQNFGILLFVQWVAALLLPFVGTGMTPLTNRRVTEVLHEETRHSIAGLFRLLWRQQCLRTLLYCLAYLPATFALSLLMKDAIPFSLFLLAGFSTLPLLFGSVVSVTLQGVARYNLLAGLRFLSTLLNLCFTLLLLQGKDVPPGMLLLPAAFASIITLTIALVYVMKLLPLRNGVTPGPLLRERIEQGQRPAPLLFLLDVVAWRELLLMLVLFLHWHTLPALGFYLFSMLLCSRLVEVVPTLFITCILPVIAKVFPIRRYTDAYDAFVQTSCSVALVAVTLCLLVSAYSPLLLTAALGTAYLPMLVPLRILLIAVVFGSISTVSLTALAQQKQKHTQVWLGLGVAAVHIALAVPCILLWGVIGAALAGTIAYIASAVGTIVLCRKELLNLYIGKV